MAGILNGPQIIELMENDNFDRNMNNKELKSWVALKDIIKYFLGKQRINNYIEMILELLHCLEEFRSRK